MDLQRAGALPCNIGIEYTVGVAGCNQRTTYVVICQEGTETCFAANPDARFRKD